MILLQKGSVAQITSNSWCLKVRNLYDRHSGAIRVHVEDRFLDLDTGQEAVLADNQDLLRYVIVSDLIGRRRMRIFTFSSGTAVLFGEFQPQGVMLRSPVFRALRKSNKGAERAIFKNCLKMSACLAHATASHGNYVLVGK